MARTQANNGIFNNFNIKTFQSIVTIDTTGPTTTVGLTPGGVILGAAILVSTAIAGLDSADHHIQLGVAGTLNKYIDLANGAAATSIAKNKKATFITDYTDTIEAAALILTITGGGDTTPSSGAVIVEVTYIIQNYIPNV